MQILFLILRTFRPIIYLTALTFALAILNCSKKSTTSSSEDQVPTEPVKITTSGGGHPTASPDGAWLAYYLPGGGIGKISVNGSQFDTLTTFGSEPDWSRTGNKIVFRSGSSLFTVDVVTGDTTRVVTGGFDDNPAWSPIGNEIAVEGSKGVTIVSYPGGAISAVPCSDPDGSGCQGEGPTWSPDGSWIAFEDGLEILKVPRAGGTAEAVVENLNDVSEPSWSPNGKWIAFTMEETYGIWHIWVADAQGTDSGLWQVTSDTTSDGSPCWSPDSRIIYFNSNRSGQYEIWKVGFNP